MNNNSLPIDASTNASASPTAGAITPSTNLDAERSEFLFLYDTRMANPNGDPEENRPRIDPYSGRNLVTEYRLKRTIRDFIKNHYSNNQNDKILIREELNLDGTRQTFRRSSKIK